MHNIHFKHTVCISKMVYSWKELTKKNAQKYSLIVDSFIKASWLLMSPTVVPLLIFHSLLKKICCGKNHLWKIFAQNSAESTHRHDTYTKKIREFSLFFWKFGRFLLIWGSFPQIWLCNLNIPISKTPRVVPNPGLLQVDKKRVSAWIL